MYSLQIHLRMDSYLGSHPSVLQHAVSVAMVSAVYEINPQFAQVRIIQIALIIEL